MHELTVTENILEIAARHACQAQAARVTDIHIVIGQLSSIVDDSVQFYWDIISAGTLCAGAKLHFERRPARLSCSECGNTYTLQGELMACPSCDSARVVIISGDEFLLESIEIEKELKE
jgi:hydrogenase nickel incorporation protein HypA/HybF